VYRGCLSMVSAYRGCFSMVSAYGGCFSRVSAYRGFFSRVSAYRRCFPSVGGPGCEVNHLPPYSTEVESEWSRVSSPPKCLYGVYREDCFTVLGVFV
jgi:hypothetical protein